MFMSETKKYASIKKSELYMAKTNVKDKSDDKLYDQYQSLLSEKDTLIKQINVLRADLDKAFFLSDGSDLSCENSLLISQLLEVQIALEEVMLEKNTIKDKCAELQSSYNLLYRRLLKLSIANQRRHKELIEQSQYLESYKKEEAEKERRLVLKIFAIRQEQLISGGEQSLKLEVESEEIESSKLFDKEWYITQYEDVARSGVDPIVHYLMYGACEGRNPSPEFDTLRYLIQYLDVADKGVNPLLHYIRHGVDEGRSII